MLIEQTREANIPVSAISSSPKKAAAKTFSQADLEQLIKKEALKTFESKLYPSLSLETIERNIRIYYKLKPVTDLMNNR